MPPEPLVLTSVASASAPEKPVAEARSRSAAIQEWRASEGDTLEGIAETLIPDNLAQQRRMLAALKRSNPQLSGRPGLADGTPVLIPDIKQKIPAERDSLPAQQAKPRSEPPLPPPAEQAPKVKDKPKPAPPKPAALAKLEKTDKTDRVVLGAPPAEIQSGDKAAPQKGSREELNERMRKMEITIQSLNAQIEALDKALALTAETLALQQKLQTAQAAQAASSGLPAPVAKPPAPPASSGGSNWLEVLFAALAGGIIAAAIAHFLGRRRTPHPDTQLSLVSNEQQRSEPVRAPSTVAANQQEAPEPGIHHDALDHALIEVKAADAHADPDESAIALAEIMLTFGRVESATGALAKHIEENSPGNPRPWLMLIDLYRRHGMREDYTKLLPALRQKLNLQPPAWEDVEKNTPGLKTLEDYAHIAKILKSSWGTQECMEYLHKLIHDTRDGQRAGFPLYVLDEIMLLMRLLEDAYDLKKPA